MNHIRVLFSIGQRANTFCLGITKTGFPQNHKSGFVLQNRADMVGFFLALKYFPVKRNHLAESMIRASVAKMHFTTLAFNQPDKKPVSYRAFVFVKGKTFVAIEAMATIKATEADFKAADAVIEGFRFN